MIPRSTSLTPREREFLELVGQGLLYSEIADRLVISPFTVANHARNVRTKFHARTMAQVFYFFIALSDAPTNSTR
jgi:DNA-binding CsgD family transcriptional regulator